MSPALAFDALREGEANHAQLRKWPTLLWLALATLLAMATWFSASAVVPALTRAWDLDEAGRAWLTMSAQLGFVVGALGPALLNLPDRVSARRLFSGSALAAAAATALIPLASGLAVALPLRFLTGLALVGVYPVAHPALLVPLCLRWGLAVSPDSAQFSALASELSRPESIGTALTLQTCLGFLLTRATIRLVPTLENWVGWGWAFAALALGPAVGIWAMARLHCWLAQSRFTARAA